MAGELVVNRLVSDYTGVRVCVCVNDKCIRSTFLVDGFDLFYLVVRSRDEDFDQCVFISAASL